VNRTSLAGISSTAELANQAKLANQRNPLAPRSVKHRSESQLNKSRAAGLADRTLAASRSVGIGWLRICLVRFVAQDNHVLAVAGSNLCPGSREYQIRTSDMKLNRAQLITAAGSRCESSEPPCCTPKVSNIAVACDPGCLLANCQRGQENRDQASCPGPNSSLGAPVT
jgi:hypothetical protein